MLFVPKPCPCSLTPGDHDEKPALLIAVANVNAQLVVPGKHAQMYNAFTDVGYLL